MPDASGAERNARDAAASPSNVALACGRPDRGVRTRERGPPASFPAPGSELALEIGDVREQMRAFRFQVRDVTGEMRALAFEVLRVAAQVLALRFESARVTAQVVEFAERRRSAQTREYVGVRRGRVVRGELASVEPLGERRARAHLGFRRRCDRDVVHDGTMATHGERVAGVHSDAQIPVQAAVPDLVERALVLLGLGAITALSILISVFHIAADAFSGSFLRGIPIAIFLLCAAVVPVLLGWLDGLRSFRPGKTPPPTPLLFALGAVEVLALGAILSLIWGFPGNYNDTTSIHLTALFQGGIAGGLTLAALGCLHYWFPKITGRALDPRGALAQFGLAILGTNLLILGLHINGDGTRLLLAEAAGSKAGGILALIGFLALFLAVAGFVAETAKAMLFGRRVGNDPWEGDTLEWLATSPPAEHNFDRLPPIESARPLADLRERIAAQGRSA